MRITNTSMIRNHMYDTQENLTRMNKINEQINSGKMINRVSDDPHKAIRIMNLNNEIKYTEKYNYNIDETVGWMDTTDGSLEHLGNVLGDIKEDILKVGNGTYSDEELEAIKAETNEKLKEIADVMNTTYAGKYMFGGTNVDEPPIIMEEKDGIVTLKINANSNTNDLRADISDGINIDYNVSVGEIFNGVDSNGNPVDFLEELNNVSNLMNEITKGDATQKSAAKEQLLGTTKSNIDNLYNHALDERTSLGVRVSTAEKVKELNEENILNMKGVLSLDQDVDQVEAFIQLKSAELVYQASIQVGTKLIQPTILDYL
ncbi:flagellar hook-associated protein FlgL [Terrisporobacter vanillatitrophus]|uniref:flagellin N-terminal helical domain-containing protein n=1 Tax=Terrisporobacter vanillatitrophus TaxID=3058402 RepID=UPI0033682517